MKTYYTLETPGGQGELRAAGVHLAQVKYQLQVREEIMGGKLQPGQTPTAGPLEIAGDMTLHPDEAPEAQNLLPVNAGQMLTLYLDDGRRFDVYASPNAGVPATYHLVSAYRAGLVAAELPPTTTR